MYADIRPLGAETRMENDPEVLHLKNVVFIPSGSPYASQGLYDYTRKLIIPSVYSRGPDVNTVFPGLGMQLPYDSLSEYGQDDYYIYVGKFHDHFGHFIASTLSRFWNKFLFEGNCKIVYTYDGDIDRFLSRDYVRKIFSGLNIDVGRLVTFDRPIKLRNVFLPVPSFEELNYAHRAFALMGNRIGQALVGQPHDKPSHKYAYLSKSKLVRGVRSIINEIELDSILHSYGVEILHPQEMDFIDQIRIWNNYDKIISFTSSALHASIFRPKCGIIGLLYDQILDTTFSLVDWSNNNDARYFHFGEGGLIHEGSTFDPSTGLGFHSSMRISSPREVGISIARELKI